VKINSAEDWRSLGFELCSQLSVEVRGEKMELESEIVFCNSCNYEVSNESERTTHYRSQWHRYNVKRKVQGMPPVAQDVFNKKLAALTTISKPDGSVSSGDSADENAALRKYAKSKAAPKSATENASYKCKLCGNDFKTKAALENHTNSKKHRKALALADLSARKLNDPSYLADPIRVIQKTLDSNPAQEEVKEDFFDPDNYESKDALPVGSCLFCPKKFEQIEESLVHMSSEHGFIVPCKFCAFLRMILLSC
jgi:pre-60S factor REI1